MPEPALTFWIVGAPLVLAIVELVRTFSALRRSNGPRGSWSHALHVGDEPRTVAPTPVLTPTRRDAAPALAPEKPLGTTVI